jgi:hypothetical protein
VALDLQQERQQAHALLDLLPPAQLGAVRSLLETMIDARPSWEQSLAAAPVDTEDVNDDTAAAIGKARTSLACGEGIAHEDILREFGLKHQ